MRISLRPMAGKEEDYEVEEVEKKQAAKEEGDSSSGKDAYDSDADETSAGCMGYIGTLLSTTLIAALYVLSLSEIHTDMFGGDQIGRGGDFKAHFIENETNVVIYAALGVWFVVYFLDVAYWGKHGMVGNFLKNVVFVGAFGVTIAGFLFLSQSGSDQEAAAPYAGYTLFGFVVLQLTRMMFFNEASQVVFLRGVTLGFLVTGCAVGIIGADGREDGNYDDEQVKISFQASVGCPDIDANGTIFSIEDLKDPNNLDLFTTSGGVIPTCMAATLLYSAPFFYFGFMVYSAIIVVALAIASAKKTLDQRTTFITTMVRRFLGFFLLFFAFALILMMIANNKDIFLSFVVKMFMFAFFYTIGLTFAVSNVSYMRCIYIDAFVQLAEHHPLIKGSFVVLTLPIVAVFFFVDVIKHFFVSSLCTSNYVSEEDKSAYLTKDGRALKAYIESWEWGHFILACAGVLNIGVIFIVLLYAFPMVLYSFFRDWTLKMSVAKAFGVLYGIGIALMLPPHGPSVLVYVLAGICLASYIHRREDIEMVPAFMIVSVFCVLIKYSTLLLIYAWGRMFRNSKKLRSMVHYNSHNTRAMRKILKDEDQLWNQTIIYVGAIDFDVGIVAGIEGSSIFSMLFCSTLYYFRLLPLVWLGTTMIATGFDPENGKITATNLMALCLSVIFHFAPIMAMTSMLEKTKDIDDIPKDERLVPHEEAHERIAAETQKLMKWENLPTAWKIAHFFVLWVISAEVFIMLTNKVFNYFYVVMSIDFFLDGRPFNIVSDVGWAFFAIWLAVCIYFSIYKKHFTKKAKRNLERQDSEPKFIKDHDVKPERESKSDIV